MPANTIHPAIDSFRTNLGQLRELLEIDQLILGIPIKLLERVKEAQDKFKPPLQNPNMRVDKALHVLRNLRKNDSVAPRLQVVRNQSIVLAVSHFTSAVRAIFIDRLTAALLSLPRPDVAREALSISTSEILELGPDPAAALADAIVRKKDVSFQDMKSISRAFKEMLLIEIPRTEAVNDIIVAQATRHAIVHNGGVVDQKLLRQIQGANPRRLRPDLKEGQAIAVTDAEVLQAAASMEEYLLTIAGAPVPGG